MRNYGSHGGGVYRRGSIEREAGKLQRGMRLGLALLTITGFVGLSVSCSGDTSAQALAAGHDGLPAVAQAPSAGGLTAGAKLAARQGDFALYILPEAAQLAQQAGRISLSVAEQGGEIVVTASVSGAMDLRGICAELAYPRARYSPVTARCGALLGAVEEQVSLCVTDTPGVAALGAVLKNYPQRTGMSGSGELAQVRFARHACTGVRRISRAPDWDEAKARLALDVTNARLEWECLLPGDYNRDGVINISDIAMIGKYWHMPGLTETYSYPDPRARLFEFDAQAYRDGDKDGTINAADFYYLGYHFGERIEEYWIYHSPDPAADMPNGNAAPSKLERAARVAYSSRKLDPVTGRYFMSIPLPDATPGDAYWVRPSDGASEGTPSNYAPYDTNLKDAFTLTVEPVTYLFGGTGSFDVVVYTQEEIIVLAFHALQVQDLKNFSLDVSFDPVKYDCIDQDGFISIIPIQPSNQCECIYESFGVINYSYVPSSTLTPGLNLGDYAALANFRFKSGYQDWNAKFPKHGGFREFQGGFIASIDYEPASGILRWWYAEPGDTNQDGSVMFDDLILLKYYFNDLGPFAFNSAEIMTDTNHDGKIDISDINAIGINTPAMTTGYFIYASVDQEDVPAGNQPGSPAIAPIGYVSFTDAQGDRQVDRLHFSAAIGAQPPGTYLWVMPECNGEVGAIWPGEYVLVP